MDVIAEVEAVCKYEFRAS